MANLTSARVWTQGNTEVQPYGAVPMAGGQKFFAGGLVGWDANPANAATTQGYAVKYDATAPNNLITLIGRYRGQIVPQAFAFGANQAVASFGGVADNSGTTAPTGNGLIWVECDFFSPLSFVWFDVVSGGHAPTQANCGGPAYAESDHEIGYVAGGLSQVGTIWRLGTARENNAGMVLVAINLVN